MDRQESALADRDGVRAIVPGNLDQSELYQRITSDDPEERMPPAGQVRTLNPREIETIRRWIEQGAKWQAHWAFVAPRRPELPNVGNGGWPLGDLDHFVLARLDKAGLQPSPPAERTRLLRRVTLDLTEVCTTSPLKR